MKRLTLLYMVLGVLLFTGCQETLSSEYTQALEEGQKALDAGNYNGVLEAVKEAKSVNEEAPEAYVLESSYYLQRGEYEKAKEALDYAIEHEKEFVGEDSRYAAYLNLGNYFYQKGQSQEALTYFKESESIADTDPAIYNAIGLAYVDLEEYDKAGEAFDKALSISEDYFYAYANLATMHIEQGEYKQALNEINLAMNMNSAIPEFYIIKGRVEDALKDEEGAYNTYTSAIARFGDYGRAYYYRGQLLLEQEKYLEAMNDFSFAKDYGVDEGFMGMGYAYKGLGQYADALLSFSDYLRKIDGVDLRALYEVGLSHYNLEDYEKARDSFMEILNYEPEDVNAMMMLAISYESLYDYANAYETYNKILAIDATHKEALEAKTYIEDHGLLD